MLNYFVAPRSSNYTEVIMEEQDYDVVVDTLEKARVRLWALTRSNMEHGMMNIMDDIRLDHIDQLSKAIIMWKDHKNLKPKAEV